MTCEDPNTSEVILQRTKKQEVELIKLYTQGLNLYVACLAYKISNKMVPNCKSSKQVDKGLNGEQVKKMFLWSGRVIFKQFKVISI